MYIILSLIYDLQHNLQVGIWLCLLPNSALSPGPLLPEVCHLLTSTVHMSLLLFCCPSLSSKPFHSYTLSFDKLTSDSYWCNNLLGVICSSISSFVLPMHHPKLSTYPSYPRVTKCIHIITGLTTSIEFIFPCFCLPRQMSSTSRHTHLCIPYPLCIPTMPVLLQQFNFLAWNKSKNPNKFPDNEESPSIWAI